MNQGKLTFTVMDPLGNGLHYADWIQNKLRYMRHHIENFVANCSKYNGLVDYQMVPIMGLINFTHAARKEYDPFFFISKYS